MSEKKCLLIVDDEEDFCVLLKESLEELGNYEVDFTTDPKQVEVKIAAARPDLIFLDNVMPGRKGSEIVESLRKDPETRDIPLVMISGRGEMVYIKKKNTFRWMSDTKIVAERGNISDERSPEVLSEIYQVDEYLSKPVAADTIMSVIKDILE